MGGARELIGRSAFGHRDVAQGIEEFDRHLQFLLEKLPHVRRARASSAKKNPFRAAALLLRSIMADRAHQFPVQARHRASHNLRGPRDFWIRWLGVSTSETDEGFLLFTKLGCGERLAKFL